MKYLLFSVIACLCVGCPLTPTEPIETPVPSSDGQVEIMLDLYQLLDQGSTKIDSQIDWQAICERNIQQAKFMYLTWCDPITEETLYSHNIQCNDGVFQQTVSLPAGVYALHVEVVDPNELFVESLFYGNAIIEVLQGTTSKAEVDLYLANYTFVEFVFGEGFPDEVYENTAQIDLLYLHEGYSVRTKVNTVPSHDGYVHGWAFVPWTFQGRVLEITLSTSDVRYSIAEFDWQSVVHGVFILQYEPTHGEVVIDWDFQLPS